MSEEIKREDAIGEAYHKLMEAIPKKDDPNTKLTEEDVEKLIEVLEENKSPIIEMIQNLPSNNGISEAPSNVMRDPTEIDESLTQEVMMEYDPVTNDSRIIGDGLNYEDKNPFDMDQFLEMTEFDRDKIQIDPEKLQDLIKIQFELPDEYCTELSNMIVEYSKDKTKQLPSFHELPDMLKTIINSECVKNEIGSKEARNGILKTVFDNIIDQYLDQYYNLEFENMFNKFSQELNGTFNRELSNISKEAMGEYVKYMSERVQQLLDLSEQKKEEDPEKSRLYYEMYLAYRDTISFTQLKEVIQSKSIKIKKIELEKYNKTFREFNYKYEKSVLNIYDISSCPHILSRHVDKKYTTNDLIKFCVAFCKYCRPFDPTYVPYHIFMYYTVYHIILLNFINGSDLLYDGTNLYQSIISNIEECMDLLKDY